MQLTEGSVTRGSELLCFKDRFPDWDHPGSGCWRWRHWRCWGWREWPLWRWSSRHSGIASQALFWNFESRTRPLFWTGKSWTGCRSGWRCWWVAKWPEPGSPFVRWLRRWRDQSRCRCSSWLVGHLSEVVSWIAFDCYHYIVPNLLYITSRFNAWFK